MLNYFHLKSRNNIRDIDKVGYRKYRIAFKEFVSKGICYAYKWDAYRKTCRTSAIIGINAGKQVKTDDERNCPNSPINEHSEMAKILWTQPELFFLITLLYDTV